MRIQTHISHRVARTLSRAHNRRGRANLRTMPKFLGPGITDKLNRRCAAGILAVALTSAGQAPALETPRFSCIAPFALTDTGFVSDMHNLPGVGVLIEAKKGLFLARVMNGEVTVEPSDKADTGAVSYMHDLPQVGVLDQGQKGVVPGACGERRGHRRARRQS